MIVENNIFHFQNTRWFKQTSGTAMGCSISVFFANSFMFNRMRRLHAEPPPNILFLGIYIDDIVGIWSGTDESHIMEAFPQVGCDRIKLTWVTSRSSLVVLDLELRIQDHHLVTTIHHKPTDSNQFVHWNSSHPRHLLKSIPLAQILRVKRNCSREEDFRLELVKLLAKFKLRGYPRDVLDRATVAADHRTRASLLGPKSHRANEDRLVLVTQWLNQPLHVRNATTTFYNKLLQHPLCTERMQRLGTPPLPLDTPLIAFRVGRNLGASVGGFFKNGSTPQNRSLEPLHPPPKQT